MKLETALDEFETAQRRKLRGEEGRPAALALDALREFLLEQAGREETGQLTTEDLRAFVLEHYPSQEEPEGEVALLLLRTTRQFAEWLLERGERSPAQFLAGAERLERELPRVMEALAVLREHTAQTRFGGAVEVAAGEEEEAPTAAMTAGVDRVVELDRIDYAAAQLDYFTVERVSPGALALRSSSRELLAEGLAEPVAVPEQAAELLRAEDIIYAEIAPVPDGWEMLEVFGVRPGGFA
ncbi:MAG: hypothetical protein ACK47B_16235 [Armatimonadota bacterium]